MIEADEVIDMGMTDEDVAYTHDLGQPVPGSFRLLADSPQGVSLLVKAGNLNVGTKLDHKLFIHNAEIKQDFRWVNDISYIDSDKMVHTLSVIECLETKPGEGGELETTKFKWVTNHNVSANNVIPLANYGGRIRWKVENEGFNVQKNGGYGLEHAYSNNLTSVKIFYFLLQIAHMLAQLLDKGSLLRKSFPAGFGSAKNLAFRLLEAWRNAPLTIEKIEALSRTRIQIRFYFDSS